MLWKFSIRNEYSNKVLATLTYDWNKDEYHMSVADTTVVEDHPPALIGMCINMGIREICDKWCRLFIHDRVIPPNRQNIGTILREIGVKYYHECFMLKFFPSSTLDMGLVEYIGEFEE